MNNRIVIGIVIIALLVMTGFFIKGSKSYGNNSSVQNQAQSPVSSSTTQPEVFPVTSQTEQQNMITLTTDGFSPQALTIKTGSTVTWVNKSGSDATVSSDPHPIHTDYPPLNLGNFSDGGKLSLIFDKSGTYEYHNHLNPSQVGTIVVQ